MRRQNRLNSLATASHENRAFTQDSASRASCSRRAASFKSKRQAFGKTGGIVGNQQMAPVLNQQPLRPDCR